MFVGIMTDSKNVSFVFYSILITTVVLIILTFLKYAFYRKQCSKIWPSRPLSLFNIAGDINNISKQRISFNFNVYLLELVSSYFTLFKNEKLFCLWLAYVPFIVLAKPEAVEDLVKGTKTMKKGSSYTFLHSWLGRGLLTSEGAKWKSRRKLLTPSFHFDILRDFLPVFNEKSEILVKILQNQSKKDFIDIVMPITLCSLDIICETTLGVNVDAQENKDSEYVKAILRVSDIIMERMFDYKLWFDFPFQFTKSGKQLKKDIVLLHNFTQSVIHETKKKLLSGEQLFNEKKKRKALIEVLLEHHLQTQSLTEEDIREEVDTFAFEGHDTTSMGMSWALYLIGLHKDVQAKLHEESDRIFGEDKERPITTDDLKDMTYLDCVLKESLRIYPSVPMISREVTEDQINICGYSIPKGVEVTVMVYHLHRNEEIYPNPEKFDPDRFLPENSAKRHPYAYIPFSAGARNCIGQRFAIMEEKVVVANIIRNFSFESLDSRDKMPPSIELILRSPVPIRMKFSPRS